MSLHWHFGLTLRQPWETLGFFVQLSTQGTPLVSTCLAQGYGSIPSFQTSSVWTATSSSTTKEASPQNVGSNPRLKSTNNECFLWQICSGWTLSIRGFASSLAAHRSRSSSGCSNMQPRETTMKTKLLEDLLSYVNWPPQYQHLCHDFL